MDNSPTAEDIDARAAHFEREENFRWLSNLLASSSSQTLTERLPRVIQQAIYALAEFAEISHGSLDPAWILAEENRRHLGAKGFPLETYPTLTGIVDGEMEPIEMLGKFHGSKGGLQGYCAFRMSPRTSSTEGQASDAAPHRPQIVLAFSGTSNARLALYDVLIAPLGYKTNHPSKHDWRVHDGFQRVYRGVREAAFQALKAAIGTVEAQLANRENKEWDLVLTAHSLGGAVSYLVLLDILHAGIGPDGLDPLVPVLPATTRVTIATFGSPRVGNPSLVKHYRDLVEEWRRKRGSVDSLTEWPIIGHMDGVPALPPAFFGYAHFSGHPYYSYGGHLYAIPFSENECTYFKVESPEEEPVLFARGGHNYYGARDMERLQRRMKPIFSEIMPAPQVPIHLGSLRLRGRRSRRSLSDAPKNKRIKELSKPHKQRAASLPEEETESPSSAMPDSPDEPPDLDSSSDPDPPDVLMDPGVEKHGNSWIENYLKREHEEDAIWMKRSNQTSVWGALLGVVSFGGFKKA